ncbi:unnamed protein product [Discula destructiva]
MRSLTRAQGALHSLSYGGVAILPRRTTALSSLTQDHRGALPPPSLPIYQRSFSQTPFLQAKKDKKSKKATRAEAEDDDDDDGELPTQSRGKKSRGSDKAPAPSPASGFDREAAFDLADVDTEYAKIDERFEKRLQEWKVGRFNPELLGQLKVQPDRALPETYPLSELASVVHRGGRNVSIIVSDASYIKPVMSAVQNSRDFNQQPQQDADNDLELVLRIEADNPEEQAKKLKAECNAWKDAVRDVLATRKSKHAKWLKAKDITKDDLKLLDKGVKALQDKKLEAIDKKEKQHQTELANRSKRL